MHFQGCIRSLPGGGRVARKLPRPGGIVASSALCGFLLELGLDVRMHFGPCLCVVVPIIHSNLPTGGTVQRAYSGKNNLEPCGNGWFFWDAMIFCNNFAR